MEVKGVLTKLIMGFMTSHENSAIKAQFKDFLPLLVPLSQGREKEKPVCKKNEIHLMLFIQFSEMSAKQVAEVQRDQEGRREYIHEWSKEQRC